MNSQLGVGLVVRCSPQVNATVDVLRPQGAPGGGGGGGQDPDPDPELIARILRMALERGVQQAQDEMSRTKQAMRSLRRSPLDQVIADIPNARRTLPERRVILQMPLQWPPAPGMQDAIWGAIHNAIDGGAEPADAAAGAAPVLPILVEPEGPEPEPPVVDVDTGGPAPEPPAPGPPVEADGPAPGPVPFPRGKPTVAVVIDEHTDRWTGRST